MKVFLSWSGTCSRAVAEALKTFIRGVFQNADVFISTQDVQSGSAWFEVLARELAQTDFGILCLTHENLVAPWILFEAGALFKGKSSSRVCTLLIGIDNTHVNAPLNHFHSSNFEKEKLFQLINTLKINMPKAQRNNLTDEELKNGVDAHYPKFHRAVKKAIRASSLKRSPSPKAKLMQSNDTRLAKLQYNAAIRQAEQFDESIEEINRGVITIRDPHSYFDRFLTTLEGNSEKERVSIFAFFVNAEAQRKAGGPFPTDLLKRQAALVRNGKAEFEYVMSFENEGHRDANRQLIEEYKKFVSKIAVVLRDDKKPGPLSDIENQSIVLLHSHKWVFLPRWNPFYGNMEEAKLFLFPRYYEQYFEKWVAETRIVDFKTFSQKR